MLDCSRRYDPREQNQAITSRKDLVGGASFAMLGYAPAKHGIPAYSLVDYSNKSVDRLKGTELFASLLSEPAQGRGAPTSGPPGPKRGPLNSCCAQFIVPASILTSRDKKFYSKVIHDHSIGLITHLNNLLLLLD